MRVLVAMSGGVDSSAAAALLVDEGHEVIGCTLRLWGGESDAGCCSAADVEDARRVAQQLSIDHHVFNLSEEFEENVVAPYVRAHARAQTPNPCVACNRTIKLGALAERAQRLGFDAVATGHHAQRTHGPDGAELRRGRDTAKDQSYVLGFTTQPQLASLLLPIGGMTKLDVRELAARRGLRTAAKPESQDVCFVPKGGRSSFLAARATLTPAEVVDVGSGRAVGTVPAMELVTVGQRRGIGAAPGGAPRYVARIDHARRLVHVGTRDDVAITAVRVSDRVTWSRDALDDGAKVEVQCSAHGRARLGTLRRVEGLRVDLDEPAPPVAPGQAAVLYAADDPTLVVGAFEVLSA